jgi:hypothetical protein
MTLQGESGWSNFLEGLTHPCWQEQQEHFFTAISSQHTGKRWNIALVKCMWHIAHLLWEDRSADMHQEKNQGTEQDTNLCNRRIRYLYSRLLGTLEQEDSYLFHMGLEDFVGKSYRYRRELLLHAERTLDS